jgi:hypothetical protein
LEERLCRRGHMTDIIAEGFCRSSARRALSTCIECTGELYLEFRKKTESLRGFVEALPGGH